ncbi:NUDIX hydrolase [Oceanobacillus bengalensis]|uniref:NUDIX domain-containing protein n=1 Tax=Oceanobacillus bengalensis TaxID=1435466 RepID=A0A494YU12_9BACI|nr:NUDIX domain-containing protein [Oceanobacillus bengalensis]RKQ13632.1 NUDIX domain-containing protein [Oceanobacillus bengalensis]
MERWDLYDINRKKLGRTHERGVQLPQGSYHLVVHVWIQNDKGEILLSRRHPEKHYGNLWECTGGSVLAGENSFEGALRETKEELGLELDPSLGKFLCSEVRADFHSDQWFFKSNATLENLFLQKEEVIDAKWVDRFTYDKMLEDNEIVPTLHYPYHLFKRLYTGD